ncbi:MAG: hypothetical protein ACTHU0_21585 [Kofleriaceae bacterium]
MKLWAMGMVMWSVLQEARRARRLHGPRPPGGDGTGGVIAERWELAARAESDRLAGRETWASVLGEETAEAVAATDDEHLFHELVQVCAVSFRWAVDVLRRVREADGAPRDSHTRELERPHVEPVRVEYLDDGAAVFVCPPSGEAWCAFEGPDDAAEQFAERLAGIIRDIAADAVLAAEVERMPPTVPEGVVRRAR